VERRTPRLNPRRRGHRARPGSSKPASRTSVPTENAWSARHPSTACPAGGTRSRSPVR